MPLLTIVIPTFNSSATIRECLLSLAGQVFKDFEIVILDNDSGDQTVQTCLEFDMQAGLLRVNVEKDNGIYDAMNKGIRLAKGEWLYFMGTDDQLHDENSLKTIAAYLTPESDIVYGDCLWVPEENMEKGEWTPQVFIQANINHQRIFYRKSLFDKYGGFRTKYRVASDHELNIRLFCNPSIRKKHVNVTVAKYHSGGFSAQKTDLAFWEDWDEIVLKNFKPCLPQKTIYGSLGTYYRYLSDKKQFAKAFRLLCKHFAHTGSLGFLKLMLSYTLKSKKN